MRNLVRRYVTSEQRQADNQGVTEDDVNEIKQDISAFRCELLEVLKNSGMNTTSVSGLGAGMFNQLWQLRSMAHIIINYIGQIIKFPISWRFWWEKESTARAKADERFQHHPRTSIIRFNSVVRRVRDGPTAGNWLHPFRQEIPQSTATQYWMPQDFTA